MSQSCIVDMEFSLLEYARLNAVAFNHLSDPMQSKHITMLWKEIESENGSPELPSFNFGPGLEVKEQLILSLAATSILASVFDVGLPHYPVAKLSIVDRSTRGRRLRLEPPLLRTDHELDCKVFQRRHWVNFKLQDIGLPLEVMDVDEQEWFEYTAKYRKLTSESVDVLHREKMAVTKDSFQYLQETLGPYRTNGDSQQFWASIPAFRKSTRFDPISPLISPVRRQPSYEPEVSPEKLMLPVWSDPASLIDEDVAAIEEHIFEQDRPTPLRKQIRTETEGGQLFGTYGSDETVTPSDIFVAVNSTPPRSMVERFRTEDWKVETPLTPAYVISTSKATGISSIAEDYGLDVDLDDANMESVDINHCYDAFLVSSEHAMKQSEQEKLVTADAFSRICVPKVDFEKPVPPWKLCTNNTSSILALEASLVRNTTKNRGEHWLNWPVTYDDNVKLRWAPFGPCISAEEDHQIGDCAWKHFVADPVHSCVIDSSALTWKPPGLKILKNRDDEDDIEHAKFAEGQSQAMATKKRIASAKESVDEVFISKHTSTSWPIAPFTPTALSSQKTGSSSFSDKNNNDGSWLDDEYSARSLIEKHLELRGIKRPKLNAATRTKTLVEPTGRSEAIAVPHNQLQQVLNEPASLPGIAFPLPKNLAIPSDPIYIIVSAAICRNRGLIKALETTMPAMHLIERDFYAHNTTIWQRGSTSRSPVISPLSAEADFIVSPCMGIVITTIQKIKQKPLPGQRAKSEIRDRLERISVRYEKLVVLVSTDASDGFSDELEKQEWTALSEFIGFTSGLECNIIVNFVFGGGEALPRWIISLIIQHRTAEELISDVTQWELFLRRAGMNVFAAQYVLASVMTLPSVRTRKPSRAETCGLSQFVDMNRNERNARFRDVCGVRLLERVSDAVDAKWSLQ